MMKHCRKSKPKTRLIRVSPEGDGVTWNSKRGDHRISASPCRGTRHICSQCVTISPVQFHFLASSGSSVAAIPPPFTVRARRRCRPRRWPLLPQTSPRTLISAYHSPLYVMNTPRTAGSPWTSSHHRKKCVTLGTQSLFMIAVGACRFTVATRRVTGLQLLIFAQRVGVYDGDLKLLRRAFDRAPQHKPGRLTYDQVPRSVYNHCVCVRSRMLVCVPTGQAHASGPERWGDQVHASAHFRAGVRG